MCRRRLRNGFALLNIRDGNATYRSGPVGRDPYKVAFGDMPVSALRRAGAEPIDVTLKLDNTGLDILAVLTPAVESAQGGVEGSCNWEARWQSADKRQRERAGQFHQFSVLISLEHITGNIVFGSQNVSSNRLKAMDKRRHQDPGSVFVGQAAWDGWH